jgi:hypothetical protein
LEANSTASAEELTSLLQDLAAIAAVIIPYFMAHNAEAEACDLLMEVSLDSVSFVD